MEKLAALGRKVRKTSLRDIPYVVATKGNGATTVSATMFFASKAPCQVDSPEECAQLIDAKVKLNLEKGVLFAVPIPEKHAASGNLIESAIQTAIREAREKKITGSAETPYVLARVSELTGGASLASNIALIKNNAAVASQTAVALAQLRLITH